MQLTLAERSIGGALLAVINFLQLEADISHTWHVIITCISIFLGTVLVTDRPGEKVIDEPAPGTVNLPLPDEKQDPDVVKGAP